MTAIAAYEGTPVVRAALQLAPLTFVRPGALACRKMAVGQQHNAVTHWNPDIALHTDS